MAIPVYKIVNWDWLKKVPIDLWHDLAIKGWPDWERDEGKDNPCFAMLVVTKGKDRSSRDRAIEFDDIAEGPFYYRDWTDSGLPFVADGETYKSGFWFALRSDRDKFVSLNSPTSGG